MICFKPNLNDKLNYVKTTLLTNGYPEDIITTIIRYKCNQFSTNPKFDQWGALYVLNYLG